MASNKLLADSLWNQALIETDWEVKEELVNQAIAFDSTNIVYFTTLAGIYSQTGRNGLKLLDEIPDELKVTPIYFESKASLYEFQGDLKQSIQNYQKAYMSFEPIETKNEKDLLYLVSYARLKTLAGEQEEAVKLLNAALELDWLTTANIDYIETFRNEFQFYQGNGASKMFENSTFVIRTSNLDSMKQVLRENHINIGGISTGLYSSELTISEKFRTRVIELGIKTE